MNTLEVIIGIVVYFLLMSLVASAIAELVSSWRRTRGRFLREAVRLTCGGGESVCLEVYRHPAIAALYEADAPVAPAPAQGLRGVATLAMPSEQERKSLPSYIPPDSFARAYLETVLGLPLEQVGDLGATFASEKRVLVDARPATRVAPSELDEAYLALRPLVLAANGDRTKALELVAEQFNKVNERAAGWYKRVVSRNLFVVGLLLAIATNGDATRIVSRLDTDPALRRDLVELADTLLATNRASVVVSPASTPAPTPTPSPSPQPPSRTNAPGTNAPTGNVTSAPKETTTAREPSATPNPPKSPEEQTREELLIRTRLVEGISGGWNNDPIIRLSLWADPGSWFWEWTWKLLGFLITAGAVSLGAPFWFDLLSKLVNVRNSLKGSSTDASDAAGKPAPPRTETAIATSLAARTAGVSETQLTPSPAALAVEREMAIFSELAYLGKLELKSRLATLGHASAPFELVATAAKANPRLPDTQAYVVRTANRLIVAFRGTEPTIPADIITDLRFKLDPVDWAPEPMLAHAGFLEALAAVWEPLTVELRRLNTTNPLPVHFCGHSLGGALAVLAAARHLGEKHLAQDQELRQRRANTFGGLHTIGQPRVGDPAFAKWAGTLFGGNYVRTVNNRDAVPRVPPSASDPGYQHFGTLHFYDSHGTLWVNPTWFFRLLDYGLPTAEIEALAKEPVADHAAAGYVGLYRNVSAQPTTPAASTA